MTKTNKYKVVEIGELWYVFRLHYVGWLMFKREIWMIDSLGFWCERDANFVLKMKENE